MEGTIIQLVWLLAPNLSNPPNRSKMVHTLWVGHCPKVEPALFSEEPQVNGSESSQLGILAARLPLTLDTQPPRN